MDTLDYITPILQHAPPWLQAVLQILGALFVLGLAFSKALHHVIIPAMEVIALRTATRVDDDFVDGMKKFDTRFAALLEKVRRLNDRIPHMVIGPKSAPGKSDTANVSTALLLLFLFQRYVVPLVGSVVLIGVATALGGCSSTSALRKALDVSAHAVLTASEEYAPVMREARLRAEEAQTLTEFDEITRVPVRVATALEAAKAQLLVAELGVDAYEAGERDDYCAVIDGVVTALRRVVEVLRTLTDLNDSLAVQIENGLSFLGTFLVNRCERSL